PREWPLRPEAEVWQAGWWGRLDQILVGDRVWVWFQTDRANQLGAVSLVADELSQQDLYTPLSVAAVNATGRDQGTLALKSVMGSKPTIRIVTLAKAEVYRGNVKAPRDSLEVGETIYVQTTGEDARLILDPAAFAKRR